MKHITNTYGVQEGSNLMVYNKYHKTVVFGSYYRHASGSPWMRVSYRINRGFDKSLERNFRVNRPKRFEPEVMNGVENHKLFNDDIVYKLTDDEVLNLAITII